VTTVPLPTGRRPPLRPVPSPERVAADIRFVEAVLAALATKRAAAQAKEGRATNWQDEARREGAPRSPLLDGEEGRAA